MGWWGKLAHILPRYSFGTWFWSQGGHLGELSLGGLVCIHYFQVPPSPGQQERVFISYCGGHVHCLVLVLSAVHLPRGRLFPRVKAPRAPALRRRPPALGLFSVVVWRRWATKESVKAAKCQRHYRQLDESQSLFKERTEAASGSLSGPWL